LKKSKSSGFVVAMGFSILLPWIAPQRDEPGEVGGRKFDTEGA
jgi:hypothetical protein